MNTLLLCNLRLNMYYLSPPLIDSAEEGELSLCEALVRMVNDSDHAVRMHMAWAVTVLYRSRVEGVELGAWPLLSREEQRDVFQQVNKMLQKAYLVTVSGIAGVMPFSTDDLTFDWLESTISSFLF